MDAYLELPRAAPEDVGMSSERLERCRDAARLYVDDGSKPCSAVLIGRCGQIVFEDTYGWSDVESGTALKEDAIFRLASMTKPITAVAGMIAYERGYFQMDDLVEKYLPEFADAQVFVGGSADDPQLEPAVNMTIKHLFTHTAGLNGGQNEAGKMQARIMREHGPPKDLEEYSKLVAKAPLLAQPGDLWHYASGLTILGRCIEVWSGKSFDVFCEEYLFAPLGMVDTGFKSQRPFLSFVSSRLAALPDTTPLSPTAYSTASPAFL